MDIRATLQQAIQCHQQRKLGEAEHLYRAVLQVQPLNAAALHNLGLLAGETGHFGPAMQLVADSIRVEPNNISYRVNQIGLLDAAGQHAKAEEAAKQLVAERPGDLKIRSEYARLLMKYGKHALAVQEWEVIHSKAPNDFAVCFHFADSLEIAGKLDLAEARYRDALRIKPDFGEAMVNLGGIMLRTSRPEEGCRLLEEAVKLLPNNAVVLATLGSALTNLGRFAEGMEKAQAAARLAPKELDVLRNLGYVHLVRGDVDSTMRIYRDVCELAPKNPHVYSTLLMTSLYVDQSGEEELKLHRGYQERATGIVKPNPRPLRPRGPGERLRIGYVSPDFRNHPVGHFIEPLLANHDRSRFEVHCFSNSSDSDEITQRIISYVDGFYPVLQYTFEQLDALIREKEIDILIDLAGHTGATCLYVFAAKPAPLQATYLGYPHTSGLDAIDIRITDATADPPGYSDTIHSERLVRLPHSFGLFHAPQGAPPIVPSPHLKNGYITFGSIGRIEKWSARTVANWAAVLNAVPDSRFRVIGLGLEDQEFKQYILNRLREAGIDPDRVELVSRKPFLEYLAEVSSIDLLLDTHPFNGHTTTLQALYMGVPTVTLAGKAHRSRMGASVMHALGLDDLIAQTNEEFQRIAVELARNPDRLTELRNTLRDRLMGSSIADAPGFARAFEELLVQAWDERLRANS